MNAKEQFAKLANTLCQIETKGNNTLIMADCIKFIHQCMNECEEAEKKNAEKDTLIAELKAKVAELEAQ